jgi:hypothetical protein
VALLGWALATVGGGGLVAAKDEIWRQSGGAFSRGEAEGVVISDAGTVRLARRLARTADLDAARVWDLARLADGTIVAATGDEGRVYSRDGDGDWKVIAKLDDTQALSLAAGREGSLVVGTGPGGRIVSFTPGAGHGENEQTQPGQDVKYVWDLAFDRDGALYAATGPLGQLWKRDPGAGGKWSLVLDSPHSHLLCVTVDRDGTVFTGSDGGAILYEVSRDGKVLVILDAPQEEIRSLAIGPDGALYAGTASGGPAGAPGPARGTAGGDRVPRFVRQAAYFARQERPQEGDAVPGTARLQAGAAGENVVYRIERESPAREIFRAKALVHALAWQGNRLLAGTSPEGRLFEVRGRGSETATLAKLDHGQILCLEPEPGGAVWIGCGSPGAVARLEPAYVSTGSLTSEVFDTKLPSRFGTVAWRGTAEEGTSVNLMVRTGSVGEPDATWTKWTSGDGPIEPGRFVQYRAILASRHEGTTPELEGVSVAYRTLNLAPEIASIDVPDLTAGDGATRKTQLDLKWEASDPNDDQLLYRLAIRKDDWPEWLPIGGEAPRAEKTYSWDTTTVPSGRYRLRVTASDRPSNPAEEALDRERVSEPFVVDHQAPELRVTVDRDLRSAAIEVRDAVTRVVKVEAALDGGAWSPCFPVDRIFDSTVESIKLPLGELRPGTHVLVVRATDAAGNVGAGDVVFRVGQ